MEVIFLLNSIKPAPEDATLETAIHKLTGLPARNLGIRRRGRLQAGYFADVVIFDPAAIQDRATYSEPHQFATGVRHVLVNGTAVLRDGKMTGLRPGRIVYGPGKWRRRGPRPPIEVTPLARQVHQDGFVFDGHNDLPWAVRSKGASSFDKLDIALPQSRLHTDIPRLKAGNVGAQFWSVYVPARTAIAGTALLQTLEQIELVQTMVKRYPNEFQLALSTADIERSRQAGKIASLIGVEGGHAIEDSIQNLRRLYKLGARYMTLTHSDTLAWADAATAWEPGARSQPGVCTATARWGSRWTAHALTVLRPPPPCSCDSAASICRCQVCPRVAFVRTPRMSCCVNIQSCW